MMKKYIFIIILLFLSCESNALNSSNDQTNNPENYFSYNISNKVAFYFFNNILINDSNLSSDDWIGAFNGEICVGARQWIDCGESTCEIPIYGENNLNQLTEGYMLPNQILLLLFMMIQMKFITKQILAHKFPGKMEYFL